MLGSRMEHSCRLRVGSNSRCPEGCLPVSDDGFAMHLCAELASPIPVNRAVVPIGTSFADDVSRRSPLDVARYCLNFTHLVSEFLVCVQFLVDLGSFRVGASPLLPRIRPSRGQYFRGDKPPILGRPTSAADSPSQHSCGWLIVNVAFLARDLSSDDENVVSTGRSCAIVPHGAGKWQKVRLGRMGMRQKAVEHP